MTTAKIEITANDEMMKLINDSIASNDRVLKALKEREKQDSTQLRRARVNMAIAALGFVFDILIVWLLVCK